MQLIRIHKKIKAFPWDWKGLNHTESICRVEKNYNQISETAYQLPCQDVLFEWKIVVVYATNAIKIQILQWFDIYNTYVSATRKSRLLSWNHFSLSQGTYLPLLEEHADIYAGNLLPRNYFCWNLFSFTATSQDLAGTHGKTMGTWGKGQTTIAQRVQGQENLNSDTGLWVCVSLTQCFHLYWEKRGIKNLIALLVRRQRCSVFGNSKQTLPSLDHREQGANSSYQQVLFKKLPK